jgi:hypothetical protein
VLGEALVFASIHRGSVSGYVNHFGAIIDEELVALPRAPSPHTKNTLSKDFRILRTAVFGPDENRKLMDLRRSGTMEAIAGDATAEQIGQTLGNDFKNSKKLQTTYAPNHLASVKKVEAARRKGRKALASADHQFRPLTFDWEGGSEEENGSP